MKRPLRYLIHDQLQRAKNILDTALLEELNEQGTKVSMNELNKALLQMEIAGLVTVRWVGKEKRRIELLERPGEESVE